MTTEEALELALEALEYIHEGANNQGPHTGISWRCVAVKAEPAIKAIKQARALDKKAENARELGLDYEPADDIQQMISDAKAMAGKEQLRFVGELADGKWKRWDGEPVAVKYFGQLWALTKPAQPAPVQEPVAWVEHEWSGSGLRHLHFERREQSVRDEVMNPIWTPLYTAPPGGRQSEDCLTAAQQEIQRLSALVRAQQITIEKLEAQRPWTGLTDEDKLMCWAKATHDADVEHKTEHQCLMDYGTEIEAKLRSKNDG
jgi:hypothetical protein